MWHTKKNISHYDCKRLIFLWSHLGLNQGPPDYESGATNQLSYETPNACALPINIETAF